MDGVTEDCQGQGHAWVSRGLGDQHHAIWFLSPAFIHMLSGFTGHSRCPPLFFFVVGLFFSSLFIVFSSSEVKLLPWLSVALDHVVEVVRGGWSPESAWTGNLHPQSGPGLWKGRLAWYSSLLLFWNSQRFWPWNSPPLSHYFIMV